MAARWFLVFAPHPGSEKTAGLVQRGLHGKGVEGCPCPINAVLWQHQHQHTQLAEHRRRGSRGRGQGQCLWGRGSVCGAGAVERCLWGSVCGAGAVGRGRMWGRVSPLSPLCHTCSSPLSPVRLPLGPHRLKLYFNLCYTTNLVTSSNPLPIPSSR